MSNSNVDFSSVATLYQKARPSVPAEIINFLKQKYLLIKKLGTVVLVMVKQQSN